MAELILIADDDYIVKPFEPAEQVCVDIIARFDQDIGELYDAADVARGYVEIADRRGDTHRFPLTSIAIGVATTSQRPIRTQWEASVIATELKGHAKRLGCSAYEVDRRGG